MSCHPARGDRAVAGLVQAVALAALTAAGCTSPRKPSIVLVVLDTTRADAVSAYGQVEGTTPRLDRLAAGGLLYAHAFANANWTMPSHASLFTGLLPGQHGLHVAADTMRRVQTLADLLAAAGYQTAGFTENPWLMLRKTGITAGFERFGMAKGDLPGVVADWLRRRDPERPFLLFVNVMDSHQPYLVREANPYLPAGVGADEARAVSQTPADQVCAIRADGRDAAVLRGLYLGNVQAADAKLARVLEAVDEVAPHEPRIVVVTADHGEYLGEQARVGHDSGLGQPVLHVPLVVHGLPGVPRARIETAVQLVDVVPSVLGWVGLRVPAGLAGDALPSRDDGARARTLVAESEDQLAPSPAMFGPLRALAASVEQRCEPEDRMSGDLRALIRFPYKLVAYARYPASLFDLAADPGERRDLSAAEPERVATLRQELDGIAPERRAGPPAAAPEIEPALRERLRALGYVDGEGPPPPPGAAAEDG